MREFIFFFLFLLLLLRRLRRKRIAIIQKGRLGECCVSDRRGIKGGI